MIWKLWNSKQNKTLSHLQELLTPINQHLTLLNQQATNNLEQNAELSEQLRKLSRLQYKSGQEVQGKFEGLNARLDIMQQGQDKFKDTKSQLEILERQVGQTCEILLKWLDDLDLLATSLQEQGQEEWLKLLGTWTCQVLQALQIHGIGEMQLVGTSFNPTLAEAIGTMVRKTNPIEEIVRAFLPYEIAEVVRRGFIYNNGTLLRKAQVITYQEDEHEK
ncbi:MAG: nucleotide exchange factor GrpE [Desulfosporosinus sp.]|nr:nucleotide exchange factor GrpE [Desulfosporosinus sp.]